MHIYSLDYDDLNYKNEDEKKEVIQTFKELFPDSDDNGIYYFLPVIRETNKFNVDRAVFQLIKINDEKYDLKFISVIAPTDEVPSNDDTETISKTEDDQNNETELKNNL